MKEAKNNDNSNDNDFDNYPNEKKPSSQSSSNTASVYECTICLENAKEPVVTKCGHIFCWPCLYSWLESKGSYAKCPNCKNPISKDNLIPIYTKEESSNNTNRFNIPKRPPGERSQNPTGDEEGSNGDGNGFSFFGNRFGNGSFSFGFFPFMGFNYNFNSRANGNNNHNQPQAFRSPLDNLPEPTKKAVINLLMLFAFIYLYLMF